MKSFFTFACMFLVSLSLCSFTLAAPTAEQRNEVKSLKTEVRKASNFIKQGKIKESSEIVKLIQERLDKLKGANEAELANDLKDLYKSLAQSHGLLELEGFTLAPLGDAPAAPAMAMTGPSTLLPPPEIAPTSTVIPLNFPANNISFTKHVAPVFIAKCGRCHVTGARGNFGATSYASLIKGPMAGVVIFPGDPSGSRLIEVIESGDMPRGGTKVTSQELTALKTWIQEGAKFDGADPNANLTSIAPDVEAAVAPRLEVMEASGNETVSFSRDLAGVLASRCVSCHNPDTDRGNLNMQNFARLLRGGDSGAPFMVGKPADSFLIKKLKGDGVERMPPNGKPLDAATIAKFEKWIAEGGKFDGEDEDVSMQRNFQYGMAKIATHDDLAKMRLESSARKWQLGFPGIKGNQTETENLLVIGDMGETALQEYASEADEVASRVRAIVKAPANQPLIKGRLTLYLLKQRYDYAEFGNMVEKRKIPGSWRGHWWYDVTDAYGAVILPNKDEYSLDGLLAQQFAGAYIAGQGNKVPLWFSDGAARVIASRINGKDPRVVDWDNQISSAVQSMTKADDFIKFQLSAEQNAVVSYGFMKAVMGRARTFESIMSSLQKGMPFEQAFTSATGNTPSQLAAQWAPRAAAGK